LEFYRHRGKPGARLPWFDLRGILNDEHAMHREEAIINIEAFMRP
jgi:hypothetical protein